jgi:hypothetical protein
VNTRTHVFDLDSERSLLGALMGEMVIPEPLHGQINAEVFSEANRLIARGVIAAFRRYGKCDLITVHEELIGMGAGLNVKDVLMGLAESAPVDADVEHLYRLVVARNGRNGQAAEEIPAPDMRCEGDDFAYVWPLYGVEFSVTHLREARDGIQAEISIKVGDRPVHWGRMNLASGSARKGLVSELARVHKEFPWRQLLEIVCRETVTSFRIGEPTIELRPAQASGTRLLVDPVLPAMDTSVLFADGGDGKSLFALVTAVAVSQDVQLPGGVRATIKGPVLFLDYESTADDHAERLHGLCQGFGIKYTGGIHYRPMTRPLVEEVPRLRSEVAKLGIVFVIIDSLGPALGSEPEAADSTIRTFNAMRELAPATRLVTSHVSKTEADRRAGSARPYGSVYVQNLARSVWEIRRAEEDGNELTIGLFHRKVNRGRLHRPIGMRFVFEGDVIRVLGHDVGTEPGLLVRASLSYRITQILRGGTQSTKQIAEAAEATEDATRQALNRMKHKRKVVRIEDQTSGKAARWGLAAKV